ncbi:methyltransferase [Bengtsoniella intestinalis]|uniref:tRNA1(Val) (adenine(37)-N6)-methyltransferase n=1 Tax=Bengtsoniella intestinalis TaxID=3073143 RepID=UPI00391FA4CF
MERLEQLTPTLTYRYDSGLQPPTTDSMLLGAFPVLKPKLRVCDLGAGCGLLGLLLLCREPALHITNLELSPIAHQLSQQNAINNHVLTSCIQGDLRTPKPFFPTSSFDLMVSNPPYFTSGSGFLAPETSRCQARSEVTCTLEDVFATARYGLKWGGHFCLVHRPERLCDVLSLARQFALEPKRLRFVSTQVGQAPSLFLLDCCRGGKPNLNVLPPLILQQADGTPTPEVDAIYFRQKETQL